MGKPGLKPRKSPAQPRLTPCAKALFIVVLAVLAGLVAYPSLPAHSAQSKPVIDIPVKFTDIARQAGITFRQDSTESDQKYYLETMGTGVGWIDYNNDGLYDLYFVQSSATDAYNLNPA